MCFYTVANIQWLLQAKVINDDGEVLPIDTPGNLCIRGYSVMLGYWDDAEKTKESILSDGWYQTGSVCRQTSSLSMSISGHTEFILSTHRIKCFCEYFCFVLFFRLIICRLGTTLRHHPLNDLLEFLSICNFLPFFSRSIFTLSLHPGFQSSSSPSTTLFFFPC